MYVCDVIIVRAHFHLLKFLNLGLYKNKCSNGNKKSWILKKGGDWNYCILYIFRARTAKYKWTLHLSPIHLDILFSTSDYIKLRYLDMSRSCPLHSMSQQLKSVWMRHNQLAKYLQWILWLFYSPQCNSSGCWVSTEKGFWGMNINFFAPYQN